MLLPQSQHHSAVRTSVWSCCAIPLPDSMPERESKSQLLRLQLDSRAWGSGLGPLLHLHVRLAVSSQSPPSPVDKAGVVTVQPLLCLSHSESGLQNGCDTSGPPSLTGVFSSNLSALGVLSVALPCTNKEWYPEQGLMRQLSGSKALVL